MSTPLDELLEAARKRVASMTIEECREMFRKQAEGWAKSEASWPKPKYHYENGTKVYHSYSDYCND